MKSFFKSKRPKATGVTHNFSSGNMWGLAIYATEIINGGQSIKGHGFGPRIFPGDWVVLPNKQSTTRYRIVTIETVRDPDDMFFFTAVFDPRSEKDREPPKPSLDSGRSVKL